MEPLLWALFGLGLLLVQLVSGLFDFLPPAVAAFALSLISLIPGIREMVWLQVLLWAAFGTGSVVWLRLKYPQLFNGRVLGAPPQENLGKEALVIEDIDAGGHGRIEFEGTTWNAVSIGETIPAGTRVVILEQENLTFTVSARPLLEDDDADRGGSGTSGTTAQE